ncbi:MAG: hypothetical protein EOP51_12405 [Sphingobacteriales bacterium]|nr:MAG: hypothetical protein EOP51_12405 [Sphingobacteriales bacterium]
MSKVLKRFKALLPRVLDVCVYEYMLSIDPPEIELALDLNISVKQDAKGYSFYAAHKGMPVNENHIIFNNRLGKQLGYTNVLMLADSNTAELYRGKNIQAYMLTYIARYFAALNDQDAVYVFTYTDNTAMQRSLVKAKYKKLYRAKVYRIAGMRVYVRRLHE